MRAPHPAVLPMIIRQGLNVATHLLMGALLGALAVMVLRGRMTRDERLEPRYPPPPSPEHAMPAQGAAD